MGSLISAVAKKALTSKTKVPFTFAFAGFRWRLELEREKFDEITADLRRPAIAIDAGRVHHRMLEGMRNMPKDPTKHRGARQTLKRRSTLGGDRIEVLAPVTGVQVMVLKLEPFMLAKRLSLALMVPVLEAGVVPPLALTATTV